MKKWNHQKCENFIKRPYFFIASYQRRALNIIFGSSESSRKFFFSDHREVNLSKFSFFAKNHGKIMFLHFLEFRDYKILHFHWFFNKNESGKNSKNHFLHKNHSKIAFFTYFENTKSKNHDFSMAFHQK